MAKAETLMPFVLSWEGGFVNDPDDAGGVTNKGVTLRTYQSIYGKHKTVRDLKRLTDAEWLYIFKQYYWKKWRADEIENQSIANMLVDWYWMSGRYGITIPQALLGVKVDGIVGPKTIAAINNYRYGQDALFRALWTDRRAYFNMLAKKGNNGKYLKGWLNRLNGIKYGRLECNGGRIIYF